MTNKRIRKKREKRQRLDWQHWCASLYQEDYWKRAELLPATGRSTLARASTMSAITARGLTEILDEMDERRYGLPALALAKGER